MATHQHPFVDEPAQRASQGRMIHLQQINQVPFGAQSPPGHGRPLTQGPLQGLGETRAAIPDLRHAINYA